MARQDVFIAAINVAKSGRALGLTAACVALVSLAGCEGPAAPGARGLCWRTVGGTPAHSKFAVVARNVASLDDCAALLEAYHLQGARTSNGAFQSYFIFIDDRQVASSNRAQGFRYPIFQPSQRREIDSGLRKLIEEHAGKPLSPGDVAVERQ